MGLVNVARLFFEFFLWVCYNLPLECSPITKGSKCYDVMLSQGSDTRNQCTQM